LLHAHEYGWPLPALRAMPRSHRAMAEAWRETPAGRFALRLYRDHRSTAPAAMDRLAA
jgi:hypothetical protein